MSAKEANNNEDKSTLETFLYKDNLSSENGDADKAKDQETLGESDKDTGEDAKKPKVEKSKATSKKRKKSNFIFNRDYYEKELGINDEKTLDILRERDEEIFNNRSTIGNQGAKNKDLSDRLLKIEEQKKELEKKSITDEEFDELSMESPSKANRAKQESEQALAEKMRLDREARAIHNQSILSDDDDIGEMSDDIKDILSNDILALGGDESTVNKVISNFESDKIASFSTDVFYNIIQRVKLQSQINSKDQEIESLSGQIESLKSDLSRNSKSIVSNINKASSSPHATNGSVGDSGSSSFDKSTLSTFLYNDDH